MDYSFVDFLVLLGAVCLFLYGMKIMSEGLQKTAGKLDNYLQTHHDELPCILLEEVQHRKHHIRDRTHNGRNIIQKTLCQ